ncbi:hypothetical protein BDF22DRAFT_775953 [Syncephalis plumigaleata]|nr:hypothetical protein BDF22DRAFT_775953 [Syncephalis plumigaleata]
MHSSSSLRQWLRELRAQLANTHTDINTVHALGNPPVEATLITRIQLVESAFPEHTRFLLRHVCVNWTLAFTNEQRKQYFDPYFLWISNKDTTTSTTTSTEMRLLLGAIHANSLRTLTNALSEDWANQDRFIMSTQMDTTTKTTPTWHDIANILCSLPTRVSNAMAGGSPHVFRHITRLIHDALEVEYIEDSDTNYELFLKHMSQFIERCIRLGYGETMTPTLLATHRRSVHNVWPHLLTRIALPQKHQLLKLILQELMHSTQDIDSVEQTLINALIQPDYLCSTNEWTQEQKNMYIHTIQQCLINTQWTSWMVYAFIKHIMSILDQQMDKDDIQAQILNQLIGHWGERVFIQSVDRAGQQRITQIILFMLKHVTRKAVKDVAHTSIFWMPLIDD